MSITTTASTNMSFDSTDSKYQQSQDYVPDKEMLWEHPAEHDSWVHAHKAIRAELRMIQECCEAVQKKGGGLKSWKVQGLQNVFDAHYGFVQQHYAAHDEILAPALVERIQYSAKLTAPPKGIETTLEGLKTLFRNLNVDQDAEATMTEILSQWCQYRADMEGHLLEEERSGLPLTRAYFTPEEYGVIVQKILASKDKLQLGSFIYHMGPDRMRCEFMKENDIPFFVWYTTFRGAYKLYERRVMDMVYKLESGTRKPKKTAVISVVERQQLMVVSPYYAGTIRGNGSPTQGPQIRRNNYDQVRIRELRNTFEVM
jgi:hypothetical protein